MDVLLGEEGLVVFEANDVTCKPIVADLFAAELQRPSRTADVVRAQAAALRAAGHEAQIDPGPEMGPLFRLDESGRRPIRIAEDGWLTVGQSRATTSALAAEAIAHPDRFSPNVLMRPLVQDALFPTVCYVAGPSEFVYHAQLRPAYSSAGLEAPLLQPRLSATIVDAPTVRFLSRYALPFEALYDREDLLLQRLVAREMPTGVNDALKAAAREVATHLEHLRPELETIDPTLCGTLETTKTKTLEVLDALQQKVVQALKRKDETLKRQIGRARRLVHPDGEPQERVLNALYFLNRHGFSMRDALFSLDPFASSQHQVLCL
jgi:bacillithiol biosynthesis cysteine-adding enzyme BshC